MIQNCDFWYENIPPGNPASKRENCKQNNVTVIVLLSDIFSFFWQQVLAVSGSSGRDLSSLKLPQWNVFRRLSLGQGDRMRL
jgi:hypothetical protein